MRPDRNNLSEEALRAIVAGDVGVIDSLYKMRQQDLARTAQRLGGLSLRPDALRRVLEDVRDRRASRRSAQLWADFVSFGTVDPRGRDAIDFDVSEDNDEAISEALFRLREIDDEVIGELTNDDIESLLTTL
jgi:hypothetical protein